MGEDGSSSCVERARLFALVGSSFEPAPGRGVMALPDEGKDSNFGPRDVGFMRRALQLASNGLGLAQPNPMVGAIVVAGGDVVGEGWHEGPGTPHAEIHALRSAGERTRGATLYVTLEPCSHYGRTAPCAPAVAGAGITRVVAAMHDPNPQVDGGGFEILRKAGVEVVVGALGEAARALNPGFVKFWHSTMPFVTLKMAASLDGKVAARDGSSRWMTGDAAREDVHRLRAASGAVVVGAGTALADDPSLTVRLPGYRGRQPLRVVVDAAGRVPATGALFDGRAVTMVATTERASKDAWKAWAEAGADVWVFRQWGADGKVDLEHMLESICESHGIHDVLIEGGPQLAWSAVGAGLVDRFVLYMAPKLVGGRDAPGVLSGDGIASISDAVRLEIVSVDRLGPDLKVVADVHGDH
jgi:diaminohydroxyphosphoribosylaminopyrimidine deaminase / 5-amino-6-(5-phosphoribosylamino)uracil reductase